MVYRNVFQTHIFSRTTMLATIILKSPAVGLIDMLITQNKLTEVSIA